MVGMTVPESIHVWAPQRKTKDEAEAAEQKYKEFAAHHDQQLEIFKRDYLSKYSAEQKEELKQKLAKLGLRLCFDSCHVYYDPAFKPIALDYDLCYVRHGKTEGNTEPRIFQGYCDYWENQLNDTGKAQAVEAAAKMESMAGDGFKPDVIFCSPLGRAIETGRAYFKSHPEIPVKVVEGAGEQQFGSWDNVQLRYMAPLDICHLFYLDQNVLVKAPKPHVNSEGREFAAENFVDLILRTAEFLPSLNKDEKVAAMTKEGKRAKVVIYGHSMAGAAISILLGHGKFIDDKKALGFDGACIMKNATPTLLLAQTPKM